MEYSIENGVLRLLVDATTYPESVIYKCFYWYTDIFDVSISFNETANQFAVELRDNSNAASFTDTLQKIQRDIIDFKLREVIATETRVIREVIIAKAFAYYDTENRMLTDVSDPVGFSPE